MARHLILFWLAIVAPPAVAKGPSDDGECHFEGNSDLYGLGVRTAFYLQAIITFLAASHGVNTELPRVMTVNLTFEFVLFIALLQATATRNLNIVEAYITVYLLDSLSYITSTILDVLDSSRDRVSPQGHAASFWRMILHQLHVKRLLEKEEETRTKGGTAAERCGDDHHGHISERPVLGSYSIAFFASFWILHIALSCYGLWFGGSVLIRCSLHHAKGSDSSSQKTFLKGWIRTFH